MWHKQIHSIRNSTTSSSPTVAEGTSDTSATPSSPRAVTGAIASQTILFSSQTRKQKRTPKKPSPINLAVIGTHYGSPSPQPDTVYISPLHSSQDTSPFRERVSLPSIATPPKKSEIPDTPSSSTAALEEQLVIALKQQAAARKKRPPTSTSSVGAIKQRALPLITTSSPQTIPRLPSLPVASPNSPSQLPQVKKTPTSKKKEPSLAYTLLQVNQYMSYRKQRQRTYHQPNDTTEIQYQPKGNAELCPSLTITRVNKTKEILPPKDPTLTAIPSPISPPAFGNR